MPVSRRAKADYRFYKPETNPIRLSIAPTGHRQMFFGNFSAKRNSPYPCETDRNPFHDQPAHAVSLCSSSRQFMDCFVRWAATVGPGRRTGLYYQQAVQLRAEASWIKLKNLCRDRSGQQTNENQDGPSRTSVGQESRDRRRCCRSASMVDSSPIVRSCKLVVELDASPSSSWSI
jgi:hypothetical protein